MPTTLLLMNERTGQLVASHVELAATRATRRKGLLGRRGLDAQRALVLAPCCSIHTAFMKFPIDVVFVDRQGRVVRFVREMKPWSAAIAMRAHAAIEFAAGSLRLRDIRLGDRLYVRPVFDTAAGVRLTASSADLPDSLRHMTPHAVQS
jgi:uncharacterized membrane protein (UPF0127 family)